MDGRLIGVLGAATYADTRTWSDDEVAAVEQLAHVVANLVQRQRTEATLRTDVQAASNRAAFDRVQMEIAEWALRLDRGSIADGLDVHLQQLGELLGADSVTLALLEGDELRRRSRWPRTAGSPLGAAPRLTYAEMLAKLPDLEPLIVEDIDDLDDASAGWVSGWRSDPSSPRAAMIVPLGAGGHFDGVLAVVVDGEQRQWVDAEVAFVRAIAGVISSHIGRLKVEASLRDVAEPLGGAARRLLRLRHRRRRRRRGAVRQQRRAAQPGHDDRPDRRCARVRPDPRGRPGPRCPALRRADGGRPDGEHPGAGDARRRHRRRLVGDPQRRATRPVGRRHDPHLPGRHQPRARRAGRGHPRRPPAAHLRARPAGARRRPGRLPRPARRELRSDRQDARRGRRVGRADRRGPGGAHRHRPDRPVRRRPADGVVRHAAALGGAAARGRRRRTSTPGLPSSPGSRSGGPAPASRAR